MIIRCTIQIMTHMLLSNNENDSKGLPLNNMLLNYDIILQKYFPHEKYGTSYMLTCPSESSFIEQLHRIEKGDFKIFSQRSKLYTDDIILNRKIPYFHPREDSKAEDKYKNQNINIDINPINRLQNKWYKINFIEASNGRTPMGETNLWHDKPILVHGHEDISETSEYHQLSVSPDDQVDNTEFITRNIYNNKQQEKYVKNKTEQSNELIRTNAQEEYTITPNRGVKSKLHTNDIPIHMAHDATVYNEQIDEVTHQTIWEDEQLTKTRKSQNIPMNNQYVKPIDQDEINKALPKLERYQHNWKYEPNSIQGEETMVKTYKYFRSSEITAQSRDRIKTIKHLITIIEDSKEESEILMRRDETILAGNHHISTHPRTISIQKRNTPLGIKDFNESRHTSKDKKLPIHENEISQTNDDYQPSDSTEAEICPLGNIECQNVIAKEDSKDDDESIISTSEQNLTSIQDTLIQKQDISSLVETQESLGSLPQLILNVIPLRPNKHNVVSEIHNDYHLSAREEGMDQTKHAQYRQGSALTNVKEQSKNEIIIGGSMFLARDQQQMITLKNRRDKGINGADNKIFLAGDQQQINSSQNTTIKKHITPLLVNEEFNENISQVGINTKIWQDKLIIKISNYSQSSESIENKRSNIGDTQMRHIILLEESQPSMDKQPWLVEPIPTYSDEAIAETSEYFQFSKSKENERSNKKDTQMNRITPVEESQPSMDENPWLKEPIPTYSYEIIYETCEYSQSSESIENERGNVRKIQMSQTSPMEESQPSVEDKSWGKEPIPTYDDETMYETCEYSEYLESTEKQNGNTRNIETSRATSVEERESLMGENPWVREPIPTYDETISEPCDYSQY